MHRFKELKVWQKSIDLSTEVYGLTSAFPDTEKYSLVSQINRCAISIPSNIAEGAGRSTGKDFARFLDISLGSCFELETQLVIASRLKFVSSELSDSVMSDLGEVQSMIIGLKKSLN